MNEAVCNEVIDEFLKVVLQCKSNRQEIQIREPIINIYECKNMNKFVDNMRLGKVGLTLNTPVLEAGKKYSIEYNLEKRSLVLEHADE